MSLGHREKGAWLAVLLALAGAFLIALAARPESALACGKDGPCTTSSEQMDCPTLGSRPGFATFNVPKDARNLKFTIKDAFSTRSTTRTTRSAAAPR